MRGMRRAIMIDRRRLLYDNRGGLRLADRIADEGPGQGARGRANQRAFRPDCPD